MKTNPAFNKSKIPYVQSIFKKRADLLSIEKDIVGIGIGPFNLSLAALLDPVQNKSSAFFDKRPKFVWHEGLLFSNAELQVHYLKDLVSLVDPTNRYSFLNFLAKENRLYHFITANFSRVLRKEFSQYFSWVSKQLPNLHFHCQVREVVQNNDKLIITIEKDNQILQVRTCDLVMGIGLQPHIPSFARSFLGKHVYHATDFLFNSKDYRNKKVVVIGGGQTGAEIVRHLVNQQANQLHELTWLSRRDNFLPIDESPFVNDLFTPSYSNHFHQLPEAEKSRLLIKQRLFSDGISPRTLEDIYQELYRLKFLSHETLVCSLIPGVDVVGMQSHADGLKLIIKFNATNKVAEIYADEIIFSTGFKFQFPDFLMPLQNQFIKDKQGNLIINHDYSLQWDGPSNCRFYMQNGAVHSRGVADPNFSLMAWRSATIVNSLCKKNIYAVGNQGSIIDWQQPLPQQQPISEIDHNMRNVSMK